MSEVTVYLRVTGSTQRESDDLAGRLQNKLVETLGNVAVRRASENDEIQSFGSVLKIVSTTAAATVIAQGVAVLLANHETSKVDIFFSKNGEQTRIVANHLSPEKVFEIVRTTIDRAKVPSDEPVPPADGPKK